MDFWKTLIARDNDDSDEATFEVWRRPPGQETTTKRPLLIIVHPGDVIEAGRRGLGSVSRAVLEQSMACQDGMGAEIHELRAQGWDTLVIHRCSSSQFEPKNIGQHVSEPMRSALGAVHRHGTVLYGDDLAEATKWIIDNLGVVQRSEIRLTGAYSNPDHGCVTAVGRGIEGAVDRFGATTKVSVSDMAYPGPGETDTWVPGEPQRRLKR